MDMKITELIKQHSVSLTAAGAILAITELLDEYEDTKKVFSELTSSPGEEVYNGLLELETLGFITIDHLSNDIVIREKFRQIKLSQSDSAVTEIINYLNEKTGRRFKETNKSNKKFIKGRLDEGYTVEDCKGVIDVMTYKWGNDRKMRMYLRPETLFNSTKFQTYYNLYKETMELSDDGDWTIGKA